MEKLLLFLKCIADENRLKILKLLLEEEYCVCQLEELLDKSQSSISQHLSYFKELDLLNEEKSSKWTYYSLNRKVYDKYLSDLLALHSHSLEDLNLSNLSKKLENLNSPPKIKENNIKRSCCQ
jgi:DNA-binding transcriptional ArsR family regulator